MFDVLESGLVLSLALSVMFAVGLDLDLRKLLRSVSLRLPLVRGLAVNLLLIPFFVVGCLAYFELDAASSAGILLCALCAGGSTGLLFSLHGRGDPSCALTLFMLLNLVSLVLMPVYIVLMVNFFGLTSNGGGPIGILSAALLSVLLFQIMPLIAGQAVRYVHVTAAERLYPVCKKVADISLVSLFVGFAIARGEYLAAMPLSLVGALVLVVFGSVGLSMLFSTPTNASGRALLYVTVVRNLTLALLINDRIFGESEITLVILAYGLLMYVVCGLLLFTGKRLQW
ncbi:hypothetical protein A9Q99_07535 [Gammaproteobacteria bacterium 45_16_T64]|nr:hypothetical protein A9Q99_07535 [Gammaproteobacteria bacterium 45_16_T64]